MSIGTSLGNYYEDDHHMAAFKDQKTNLQNAVDKATQPWNDSASNDDAMIIKPSDSRDSGVLDPDKMQRQKLQGEDPNIIYDDSGAAVDYNFNDSALPPPEDNTTLIHPIANVTNTPDEIAAGLEGARAGAARGGSFWKDAPPGGVNRIMRQPSNIIDTDPMSSGSVTPRGATQMRSPANDNKNLDLGTGKISQEDLDLSWNKMGEIFKKENALRDQRMEMINRNEKGGWNEFEMARFKKLGQQIEDLYK